MIAGGSARGALGRARASSADRPRTMHAQSSHNSLPPLSLLTRGRTRPRAATRPSLQARAAPAPQTTAATEPPAPASAAVRPAATDPAAAAAEAGAAPPPPEAEVRAEPTLALRVAPTVTLLRSSTRGRLKLMVEYALRRGSTDNCYLLSARAGEPPTTLVDLPFPTYAGEFLKTLKASSAAAPDPGLGLLTHIVSTHLGPNRVAVLADVLEAAGAEARAGTEARVRVVLSNPGVKVLEAGFAALGARGAALRAAVEVVVLKAAGGGDGVVESVEVGGGLLLRAILVPTPRWPDAVCLYDPASQVLFTGKFFSAHVSPEVAAGAAAGRSAFDGVGDAAVGAGGWESYGEHWRYFFDCMLAPVPTQASAALARLPVTVSPLGALNARATAGGGGQGGGQGGGGGGASASPSSESAAASASAPDVGRSVLTVVSSAVFELTRGAKGAGAGAGAAAPPSIFCAALAPSHGPCVRACLSELVGEYGRWADAQAAVLRTGGSAAVMYASAYGNTTALAAAIARGVTKAGVAVRTLNLEDASLDEVAQAVRDSDAFVLGSPTLGGHMPTQVSLALGTLLNDPSARALPAGVFGSFGWSGEAVDEMESRLRDGGFRFAFPAVRVKFRPTAQDLVACEQAGRDLAVAVRRRRKALERGVAPAPAAAAAANSAQLAVGRVVGSLCVVTARNPDDVEAGEAGEAGAAAGAVPAATEANGAAAAAPPAPAASPASSTAGAGAMLASWVSQASFDPPGITVAVKRDRAMEPLLMPGAAFAISLLAEGRERTVVRALARPFAPGVDRLAGLDTRPSDGPSGAPVLADALATLDCRVQSRMEAGDHYIMYAVVEAGKLRSKDGVAAVHHRKVGNHY